MRVSTAVEIKGTKEQIWKVVTDIEGSKEVITAIKDIEILNKPADGFLGFKWKEARTMFGKEATEIMWVVESEENKYYQTRAESHGAIYLSSIMIKEKADGCILSMGFESQAVSFGGRLMDMVFGRMMAKSTEKALNVDLADIKAYIEQSAS
jgi:uncharacterized membrane protein